VQQILRETLEHRVAQGHLHAFFDFYLFILCGPFVYLVTTERLNNTQTNSYANYWFKCSQIHMKRVHTHTHIAFIGLPVTAGVTLEDGVDLLVQTGAGLIRMSAITHFKVIIHMCLAPQHIA